jgi:hypothetical protein
MNSPTSPSPEAPHTEQTTEGPNPEILYPRVGPLAQKLGSLEISGTFAGGRSAVEIVPSTIDISVSASSVAGNAINRLRRDRLSRRIEKMETEIPNIESAMDTGTTINRTRRNRLSRRIEKNNTDIPSLQEEIDNPGVVARVAEINIKKRAPAKEYNPLKSWDTHVKRRPLKTIHHTPTALSAREGKPVATNSLQEMRQQKMERLHQEHSKLGDHIERFTELYGDVLYDSAEVERLLSNGDFTRGEKKSIRQAGKVVRSYENKSRKIATKLENTASGKNTQKKIEKKREQIIRDERKITKLEAKARARNEMRIKRKEAAIERFERRIPELEAKATSRSKRGIEHNERRIERRQILSGAKRSAQINRQLARSKDPSVRKIIYDQASRTIS